MGGDLTERITFKTPSAVEGLTPEVLDEVAGPACPECGYRLGRHRVAAELPSLGLAGWQACSRGAAQ